MAVNSAFHTNNVAALATEQNLYKNLVAEVIQIYGHDVHYLDRTLVAEDTVFGEDTLSKFRNSAKIEMYVENAGGGYAGEKELMTKFGLQDLSEITFVVAKHRFQELTKQFTIEDATDTASGGSILLEADTIDMSDNAVTFEGSDFYLLSETDATGADRPLEGDLVFHPILKKLFEVNFVNDDEPFHQLDTNPVYKLSCRTFDYSSERLDTGIPSVDAIEDALSVDTLVYQVTLEQSSAVNESVRIHDTSTTRGLLKDETDNDNIIGEDDSTSVGENLLLETGEWLLQEDYIIGEGSRLSTDADPSAQNELFDRLDDTILDFSENNPFGDAGSLG